MRKNSDWFFIVIIFFTLVGTGCNRSTTSTSSIPTETNPLMPAITPFVTDTSTVPTIAAPSRTVASGQIPKSSPSTTATLLPSPSLTPLPTFTFTPGLTPTYAILRGTVLEQANCRYGPGAAYLYKYGLYPGNNIEIIGRNEPGTWIVIRAIGGTNPCWVKASLLDIHGEVMSVTPAELPLPMSPYYGPLTGIFAERNGNDVTISWNPMELRAGDDSLQYPYLVEAWLCQNGQLTFSPIGSWETVVTVQDEPGCSNPSLARVYGVEKHGYTLWMNVPWPPP